MTRYLLTMTFLALAAAAHAQPSAEVNLATLGLQGYDLQPVEADGDAETEEWLGQTSTNEFRMFAVNPGGLCQGGLFVPAYGLPGATIRVVRKDGRDWLLVRELTDTGQWGPTLRLVALVRPRCGDE